MSDCNSHSSWPVVLRSTSTGVMLPVHAQPGARRNGVTGIHNGRLKVAVTQAAEKGKANKELIRLLATVLGVSKAAITLKHGETSHLKDFHIADLAAEQVIERLRPLTDVPDASRTGR